MDDARKQKIREFWRAKTALTAGIFVMTCIAFLFVMTDRTTPWIPWLFIATGVAAIFFDLRKGVCPFCGKLINTVKLTKAGRFRFCPHCGQSIQLDE